MYILEIPASGVGHSTADEATSAPRKTSLSRRASGLIHKSPEPCHEGENLTPNARATQHKNGAEIAPPHKKKAGIAPTHMKRDDSGGTREKGVRCGHTCGCVPAHLCCTAIRTVHRHALVRHFFGPQHQVGLAVHPETLLPEAAVVSSSWQQGLKGKRQKDTAREKNNHTRGGLNPTSPKHRVPSWPLPTPSLALHH